jgi:hypothetical protein
MFLAMIFFIFFRVAEVGGGYSRPAASPDNTFFQGRMAILWGKKYQYLKKAQKQR